MPQILFIAALLLIVLLALNFEFLLIPNLITAGAGGIIILLGVGVILSGAVRERKTPPPHTDSGPDKAPRSAGCAPAVAGGLYVLTGVGVLVLQAIGYLQ